MSPKDTPEHSREWLRHQAREVADGKRIDIDSLSHSDIEEIIHEFGTYQNELLSQNEELKQSYQSLEELRNAYADLYEFAPVGYLIVNRQGLINTANLTACTMLKLERSRFLQAPLSRLFAQNHHRQCHRFLNTLFKESREESLDTVFQCGDGNDLPVRLRAKLRQENNQTLCRLAVLDISREKEQEQGRERLLLDLRKSKEEAEAASHAKSDFLAKMSHEIRTPMNSILGMLRLSLLNSLEPEQRRRLAVAKESAEALLDLLNDLLDLSKIEAGKFALQSKDFSLRRFLNTAVQIFRPMAQEKGISLNLEIVREIPARVFGDPQRLRQIMNNLLSNAIKFTDNGEVNIEVARNEPSDATNSAEHNALEIQFRVRDTGSGINSACFDRIFESYEQSGYRFEQQQGTGLGLAICKRLITEMSGRIWVESSTEQGSVFTFVLPFESDGLPEEPVQEDTEKNMPSLPPLHILLVEDQPMNQVFTEDLLTSYGHLTDIAENGQQALKMLEKKTYDLVLMDLRMPVMDGMEATTRIRTGDPCNLDPEIPVIALSAHVKTKSDEERFFCAGFDGYIVKPVEFEKLFSTIRDVLGNRGLLPEKRQERGE